MAKTKAENRRKFLRAIAAAPMIPALGTVDAQEATSQASAAVDARAEVIRLRFGQYLADDDMPEIKRGIERLLRNAEAINRIKITNGDEPDFMFHPRDV